MESITFPTPWDAHLHLRDDTILKAVAPLAATEYWGGIIMPNLKQPVVTTTHVQAYRERINKALGGRNFAPAMTLYLTDNTDPEDVRTAFETHAAVAVKLYPRHGTTNSGHSVTKYSNVMEVLKVMEEIGMPLLIHGERPTDNTGPVDHYDREALFMANELTWFRSNFPRLRISLEHITTREAADLIAREGGPNLVATITPQHLFTNRRYTIYNSDAACMPIIKAEEHMMALRELVASGCPWVHLGTDCAPHFEGAKEAVVCACGCFTAPHGIPLYLQAFDEAGALRHFAEFASVRGPKFFGLKPATQLVTYQRHQWQIERPLQVRTPQGTQMIRPFGYRTKTEEESGLGQNLALNWKKVA